MGYKKLVFVLGLWVIVGCGSPGGDVSDSNKGSLTVFAAASLTDVFTELGQLFEAQHPGVTVQFNFAGSSELATQLAEGAPADLFASANQTQMDNAVAAGRITGEPSDFLTNRLVVIVPAENPANIKTLADLAREGVKFVSALPDVPIRVFTEQMLDNVSADPVYGAGFKSAVFANLVSEETNVRQLTAKVVLGEADAAVVYQSDVTADIAAQVQMIVIPETLNVVAVYPIGLVDNSTNPEMAQTFIELILGAEGQTVLAKWGFGPRPISP